MEKESVETKDLAEFFPSPVSKEIVDKALTEIARNPEAALMYENNLITAENPKLGNYILIRASLLEDPRSSSEYVQGAAWLHRILRQQATEKGQKLPRVSSDLMGTHFQDLMQEIRETKADETILEMFKRFKKNMVAEESELDRAFKEITKFRVRSEYLWGGAADIYFLLKAAAEAKKLGEQFKKE